MTDTKQAVDESRDLLRESLEKGRARVANEVERMGGLASPSDRAKVRRVLAREALDTLVAAGALPSGAAAAIADCLAQWAARPLTGPGYTEEEIRRSFLVRHSRDD